MGRFIVVFLASFLVMLILVAIFPGLYHVAFTIPKNVPIMGDMGIKWGLMVGLGVFIGCYKLTGK